jgi:hypothetical protein
MRHIRIFTSQIPSTYMKRTALGVTGPFVLYLAQGVTRMKLTQKLNFKPNCTTRGSCTLVTVADLPEPNVVPRALTGLPRRRSVNVH